MKSHYTKNIFRIAMFFLLVKLTMAQSVTPNKVSYGVDENITVTFAGGPGNAADWIAIYPKGIVPSGSPAATEWFYTNGTKTSGGNLTAGNLTFTNPNLAAGNYSLWFLRNDGYNTIAGPTDFVVTEPVASVDPSWIVNSIKRRHGVVGVAYTGRVSAYTNLKNYSFSKVTGPAWLSVSASGELSGTPPANSVGSNSFTVRASNGTAGADVTLKIEVFAPNTEIVRELKVMSCNAWHGWGQMNNGHRKGLTAIILSGADIIGMQESTDNVSGSGVYQPQKIADDLGWYYRSNTQGSLGIISRYPISDQTLAAGMARGVRIKVTNSPLQEVVLMNCHLDYTNYGPYAAQLSGATEASVLTEENRSDRPEQITSIMAAMSTLLSNSGNTPVFLTGDFNAPSHLDWTAATSAAHGGVGSVAWPTSTAVLNAGMKDSYRAIHANPVASSGDTWSPVFKGTEPQDRIDFVYYKGSSVKPVKSITYTTAVERTVGAWGSSIVPLKNNTWPSDHASVVTTFSIKPVDADSDGLSDAYETSQFGDTFTQDGEGDADSDGVSNELEQAHGTDPNNPSSFPVIKVSLPEQPQTNPSISFSLSSFAIHSGLICEGSTNLSNWTKVWSYNEDPNLTSSIISTTATGVGMWDLKIDDLAMNTNLVGKLFYRVRLAE